MRKDLTEVVFILDRSGSMSGLETDTIGGFNSMIQVAVIYIKVPDTSIVYRVFGTICIFLISALIAKGLQKIPGVRKIIPS